MRNRLISLDSQIEDDYLMEGMGSYGDNTRKRERMKRMLSKAMLIELTARQNECLSKYYFENKSMAEIADELGINKSTVSRHIRAARRKLTKLNLLI